MLALTVIEFWDDGKRIHLIGQVTASGNYATGGDTLDVSVAGPAGLPSSQPPMIAWIDGLSGYDFVFAPGTAQNNGKVKVFANGAAAGAFPELASGAYPAAIIADTIMLEAVFHKLR